MYDIKFRVWHIPQVPMKAFYVEVNTFAEADNIRNALADYDLFQYYNNVKGDYCNASGIQIYDWGLSDEDLVDMELDDRWYDIDSEDEVQEIMEYWKNDN